MAELDLVDLFDVVEEEDEKKVEDTTKEEDNQGEQNSSSNEEDTQENEEEDLNEEDLDNSIVKLVMKQVGIEFEDEFEDSEEGIAQYTRKAAEKMAEDFIHNGLPEQARDLIQYLQAGGDPSVYIQTKFPETDYSKIEFNEEDINLHEQLVRADLVAKGYSGEEIKQEIEDFKNGGLLESRAKRALSSLQAKQQQEQDSLVEKQIQAQTQAIEDERKYWESVKNTILKSSEFKGLKVPENEKNKFFDYLSKPVQNNKSQRDLDLEKLTDEDSLAIDWLLFKGFDLNSLVERRANDKKVKTLKERLAESKLRKQGESRQSTQDVEIVL